MTSAPIASQVSLRRAALAAETEKAQWPPGALKGVSPAASQSKIGPGLSSGRAMKPSRETEAPAVT